MQNVEGSSPFIRFTEPAGNGGFFYALSLTPIGLLRQAGERAKPNYELNGKAR